MLILSSSLEQEISEMEEGHKDLHVLLPKRHPSSFIQVRPQIQLEAYTWKEIRLFLSSSFIDTHGERDSLIKRIIPSLNRRLAPRYIYIVPVDLRWGVINANCQSTCLNQIDKCRQYIDEYPWFLGIRTDRYGWIQKHLLDSEKFENSERFGWIKTLQEYEKQLSITSLECIHATIPPGYARSSPTVFFYKRHITNPEDIEEDLRWVFDLEYVPEDKEVDPKVQYQYTKTPDANIYKDDRESLDMYLEKLDHVKYFHYECHYDKGNARYTSKKERTKSFGIGYVSGLKQFEKQVEEDLWEAIDKNFKAADTSDIPEHHRLDIPHENAVNEKASTFIGRAKLFQQCYQHCTSTQVDSSVMIIHGDPGCGKSALLAAVSSKCLDELRNRGEFVFVHAVDSSPGSNNLESMLKRLHVNLKWYRDEMYREDDGECPNTADDLRRLHVDILEQTAAKHPEELFIILVDAVNQFHETLQCWKMWWLPSRNAPKNLRFVISTLNKENGTFENALRIYPNALTVEVGKLSEKDGQEMVSASLARFNKKLTTKDHDLLGNQMSVLLSKNLSPLYITVATQALRRFGVYEEISKYIHNLPSGISDLFSFLLDQWSEEYGKQFTKDVTGLLCVSKDGLLENQINDILFYKECTEDIDYDCSFSRLYDSICSFLAAGGGGFLRYFHDQLKFEVERKFLTSVEEKQELHTCLVNFYLKCIRPQLREVPNKLPPAYYNHCLQLVVYHQVEIKGENTATECFMDTLRNIYFLRERVNDNQEGLLQQEYVNAIQRSANDKESQALKHWAKFTQLYSPYMKKFPNWSYNMAINQHPNNYVAMDSKKHPRPAECEGYPYYWRNIPCEEDAVALKYTSKECWSCCVSPSEKNICCIGGTGKVSLFEADSGVLIREVDVNSCVLAVYLSARYNTFWTEGRPGYLSVRSVETGVEEWSERSGAEESDHVIWIASVGEHIACGTSGIGSIVLLDEEERKVIKSWSTKSQCYSYCFHSNKKMIISGHVGGIKCWCLDGYLVRDVQVGAEKGKGLSNRSVIHSLSIHPVTDDILLLREERCFKQVDITLGETISSVECGKKGIALYDSTGKRIVCTDDAEKTIMVYDTDGKLQNTFKGYLRNIRDVCLVPGTDDLLVAARDGSMLFNLPATPDHVGGGHVDEVIKWCNFLPCGEEFVTLNKDGKLQVWNTHPCERKRSVNIEGVEDAIIYPDGKYIIAHTNKDLFCVETVKLKTVATCNVIKKGKSDRIIDIKLSPNGRKCVVVLGTQGAIVFNTAKMNKIKRSSKYRSMMWSCDVHEDNKRVVCGRRSHGVDMWNISTGKKISTLREESTSCVKFLHDQVLYVDGDSHVHVMDIKGVHVITLKSKVNLSPVITIIRNKTQLMTAEQDKTIRFHDLSTGKVIYTFVDHRSEEFCCLAEHPTNNIIIGGNDNGMFYILKNSQKSQMYVPARPISIFAQHFGKSRERRMSCFRK